MFYEFSKSCNQFGSFRLSLFKSRGALVAISSSKRRRRALSMNDSKQPWRAGSPGSASKRLAQQSREPCHTSTQLLNTQGNQSSVLCVPSIGPFTGPLSAAGIADPR